MHYVSRRRLCLSTKDEARAEIKKKECKNRTVKPVTKLTKDCLTKTAMDEENQQEAGLVLHYMIKMRFHLSGGVESTYGGN